LKLNTGTNFPPRVLCWCVKN